MSINNELRKLATAYDSLTELERKTLGNVVVAGHGEDEVAESLGLYVEYDECGSPVSSGVDQIISKAYKGLARAGFSRDFVNEHLDKALWLVFNETS